MSDPNEIVLLLHALLAPLGFKRTRKIWNRRAGSLVSAIVVQTSKVGGDFTINVGVADVEVYELVWGKPLPKAVSEPYCAVARRLGFLLDGRDRWWNYGESGTAEDATDKVRTHGLTFLDRLSSREAMRQWLADQDLERRRDTVSLISLAIIECLLGDQTQGYERLAKLRETPWRDFVDQAAERLRVREGTLH